MLARPGKTRFGPFEFDPRRHELRKGVDRIWMSASQLRLLTLFLERPGDLVTREEIAARLWTDAHNIDVPTGINTAINRMRGHLQASPKGPVSIETVIGLGYRFVADVEQVEVTESEASPSGGTAALQAPEAAAEFAEAGTIEVETSGKQRQPTSETSMPVRTAFPARFAVPVLCGVALLAVLIAYGVHRWGQVRADRSSQAATGVLGPLIRITAETEKGEVTTSAVSPDGQSVAYSDRSGVSVHWFASGQERLLGARPSFTARRIAWFPDGSQLLMSGTDETTHRRQVWLVPLQGAYLHLIAEDADLATVSPDGGRIAWTRDGDRELWLAGADGQSPRRLAGVGPGESFRFVLWFPAGDRLLATVHRITPGDTVGGDAVRGDAVARYPVDAANHDAYESIDALSGRLLDREEGFSAESGYILDDGRFYFPYNGSPDVITGGSSLMMVRTDRHNGRLLGAPTRIRGLKASFAGSLTASLSGARFAAVLDVTRTDVFAAELRQPGPALAEVKTLTHGAMQNYPHAWTPDGNSVLIENDSRSRWSVYEQPLDGSDARLIASMPENAAMAELSPDGRWVLFLEFTGRPQRAAGVFRVPLGGGRIEQVPTKGQIEEFHCSASSYGNCVLREVADNKEFVYYELDPIQGMGQELGRTPWQPNRLGDWGLSPDGLTVAAANHDMLRPGISLARLRTKPTNIDEIALRGHGSILGSNWAADGKSLFVECRTEVGFELVSIDLAGHVKSLRESSTLIWATPSRDGRKIAFPGLTISRDVWALGTPAP
jgi:DNA-binding winged helix-turn-helix (wHTH) protein/Tol biopolymer transport system component